MKARGFTLLELVIVMVLIGISAVFGTRFIAQMAESHVGGAERAEALAGARFTLERLRRELAVAYGPSVYLKDDCLAFVPARAAGTYTGSVRTGTATFIVPLSLQDAEIKDVFMAIRAEGGEAYWSDYPNPLNVENVYRLEKEPASAGFGLSDVFNNSEEIEFNREGLGQRYTLLKAEQVRYCLRNGNLEREVKSPDETWGKTSLMLTGITGDSVFLGYDESSQLVQMELTLSTRDGELVLPGQLQVAYAP
ncbi:mannose-sensitive agglutinin biogenesis protein MshO [Oceanimonas sp. GK1]|uniref:PulJ/GspJ family protein n=1 Tax=Oceanimonas sp. (strain GK1 / IBRC-M 10197) TaxID=511062 RepID=UPI0002494EE2|nr:type II secretion system protein [Oceanimonas sp. GK1]AEY01692.1 mannose-sensitive agglutinin biogenesis protein MshO [Oceanimonas sp. GK1]